MTGKERTRAIPHDEAVLTVRFSPDGKLLATATRSLGPYLWCAITWKPVVLQKNARGAMVVSVAFSPGGDRLAAAHDDGLVVCWNTETGQPLPTALDHNAAVTSLAFRPDGKTILTGCLDRKARLWDLHEAISVREFSLPAEVGLVAVPPRRQCHRDGLRQRFGSTLAS